MTDTILKAIMWKRIRVEQVKESYDSGFYLFVWSYLDENEWHEKCDELTKWTQENLLPETYLCDHDIGIRLKIYLRNQEDTALFIISHEVEL